MWTILSNALREVSFERRGSAAINLRQRDWARGADNRRG